VTQPSDVTMLHRVFAMLDTPGVSGGGSTPDPSSPTGFRYRVTAYAFGTMDVLAHGEGITPEAARDSLIAA